MHKEGTNQVARSCQKKECAYRYSANRLEEGTSRNPVCSIVREACAYLVLRRVGEASATRGDLNILWLCIKLRDPG